MRERFIAEAGGNPLALLELPQGLTPAELAGAFGVTVAPGLLRRLEDSFGQRLAGLPETTQRLLLVAAAEPTGDTVLGFPSAGLHEAYTICSVAGDLKINETVDLPNWLVSMTLPRGIFA